MTSSSSSVLHLGCLLLLLFRPSCAWIDVGMRLLEQLLIRCIWRLLSFAEWVVQFQEDAAAKPQLHFRTRGQRAMCFAATFRRGRIRVRCDVYKW
jgi:hypothetical protein